MTDRILVVEDDPALLRGLTDNLRAEAYDVLTATDGRAAVQVADAVLQAVLHHSRGRPQADDVTILAACVSGSLSPRGVPA